MPRSASTAPAADEVTEFQIEKDIPVPDWAAGKHSWPFAQMEIGDSFFVPPGRGRSQIRVSAHAGQHGKRFGKKFVTRNVPGGVRVWRVK